MPITATRFRIDDEKFTRHAKETTRLQLNLMQYTSSWAAGPVKGATEDCQSDPRNSAHGSDQGSGDQHCSAKTTS